MGSLADLAAVAIDLPASVQLSTEEILDASGKRKRASPLEAAIKAVAVHSESLKKAESKLLLAQNAPGLNRNKTLQTKLDGHAQSVAKFTRMVQDATAKVEKLKETARLAGEAAQAKRVAAEEKTESNKHLSDAALMNIVEIRIKYQKNFDNSSDVAATVWAHVHADYIKKITDGTLAESDRISSVQMQRRWSLELGKFRLWCSTANRAMSLSGVTRDRVEEDVGDIGPNPNHCAPDPFCPTPTPNS